MRKIISSQRGILLPMALFLILALSAASLSALLLARTELLSASGDHRYLQQRATEEEWHASFEGEGAGVVDIEGRGGTVTSMGGGFFLLRASEREGAPAGMSVYWQLLPDSASHHLLPGGMEIGEGAFPDGIRAMTQDEGCPPPHGRPLMRIRPAIHPPLPDPPLPRAPRLGLLGVAELLEFSTISMDTNSGFPDFASEAMQVVRVSPGGSIQGGEGSGILLSEGDIHLTGEAQFRGLLLVEGNLLMEEGARVEGVVLVGGAAQLRGGSMILGCPGIAGLALDRPEVTRPLLVSGGEFLGRF